LKSSKIENLSIKMHYDSNNHLHITNHIVDFLHEFRTSPLLENAYYQAKICLLDYLGVTIAGSKISKNHIEQYVQLSNNISGASRIIGQPYKTDIVSAILLNGISSHIAEMDDGHRFGMIHLASPIITPLLLVAEQEKMDGEDFLRGIILGYEIAIQLASSMQPSHRNKGFHTTATCGTIGAAVGIASALKYNKTQLKSTISAAATSASGILEIQEDGSELKPYNPAIAAVNGFLAARIGRVGFLGPDDILGGKRGFLSVMSDNSFEFSKPNIHDLGILNIYLKPYASCRHCHSAIEATLQITSENHFEVDKIQQIRVHTYSAAVNGHDHKTIHGTSSAKMSLPYSVAVAVHSGKANINEFDIDSVELDSILSVMEKVDIFVDSELSALAPRKRAAMVEIETTEGAVYKAQVDYPRGEPENPMSLEEIINKFLSLSMYGGKNQTESYQIIEKVNNIETDFEYLFDLL
jgi:2-methylcitrate dehydratase PrpD